MVVPVISETRQGAKQYRLDDLQPAATWALLIQAVRTALIECCCILSASQAVLTSCKGSTLPLTSSECAALPGMLLKSPATSMGMSALQEKQKQRQTQLASSNVPVRCALVWPGDGCARPGAMDHLPVLEGWRKVTALNLQHPWPLAAGLTCLQSSPAP
jgi:hypothetical protein